MAKKKKRQKKKQGNRKIRKMKKQKKQRVKKYKKKKTSAKKTRRIIKVAKKSIKEKAPEKKDRIEKNLEETIHKTKIRVIGIGGGAGSIVSEIAPVLKKADFIVANTDSKSLNTLTKKVKRFQFGQSVTRGLGTGMNSQLGETSALNEKERIKKLLKGQDLCIIVSCLGGGTSSGATPVFAKISKSLGNLTYGIFTLPFDFEGEKKMEMANTALEKIKPFLNAYSVIPNERIFQIIDKNTPLKSAFSAINKRLADNLEGLIEMIYFPGLINIDFADLGTILSGKGKLSYLNTIEIENLGKEDAIKKVVSSSLYPYTIKGAKGILYNIKGGSDLKLSDVSYISKIISELINKKAKIIFGISQNKNLKDKIKITLLAVGCGRNFIIPKGVQGIKTGDKTGDKKRDKKETIAIKGKKLKKIAKIKSGQKKSLIKKPTTPKKLKKKKTKKATLNHKRKVATPFPAKAVSAETLLPQEVQVKVRKNGLALQKVVEEEEKEILEQEKIWETPAILRKKNNAN